MHLQNALDRLKRSGTTYQYLVITEVQREVQRLADAYDRVEKTLKETQDAAYWFLDSLQYAANTKVSMNTQQKITALRNALDKSGYRPIGRDESPLPPPKNPNGRPDHIADADKMVLDDPHPPHRLCECTACLEYWTPKPTCDHIAGGGKVMLTTEQAQQIEETLVLLCKTHPEVNGGFIVNMALNNIRAARAQEQAEQDLDTCPGCGGVADNGHDREFPPKPYYCTKCSEQAEQEPAAWMCWIDSDEEMNPANAQLTSYEPKAYAKRKPLYAAPQPVQKPTDCPCCGAKGTVIPSAFCRECKSDFWPPSVPANPTQPD